MSTEQHVQDGTEQDFDMKALYRLTPEGRATVVAVLRRLWPHAHKWNDLGVVVKLGQLSLAEAKALVVQIEDEAERVLILWEYAATARRIVALVTEMGRKYGDATVLREWKRRCRTLEILNTTLPQTRAEAVRVLQADDLSRREAYYQMEHIKAIVRE